MSNATKIYSGADKKITTALGTPRFANSVGPATATAKTVCTLEAAAMMPEMNVSSADRSVEIPVASFWHAGITDVGSAPHMCAVAAL